MTREMIRIEFDGDGHPEEAVLLLSLEGELSETDAAQVEAHSRGCRLCRTRLSEWEQGFAVYQEYHETVFTSELEAAPNDFREFRARLKKVSGEGASSTEVRKRTSEFWSRLFGAGVPLRWVPLTAAVTVLVFFVTQDLLNPVRLSAAEFLERASSSQNPPVTQRGGGKGKKAHQKVRITRGGKSVVRDFQWTPGSSIPNASWQSAMEPEQWNAPLTAEGFSQWRNSLSEKEDKIKRTGDQWMLDTTGSGNLIREAWIVVRASDFHPTRQHIRFSDDGTLDFEELAFDVTNDLPVDSPLRDAQNVPAQQPANRTVPPVPQTADPNETELQIRYVMFQKEWDLGEDLEIAKTGNDVAVSGAASSPERAQAIREALGQIPGARLDISSPPMNQVGGFPAVRSAPDTRNPSPLLKKTLENAVPLPEQRRDFVDSCLAASDTALSHASTLMKLAERYDAASENTVRPDSDAKLREMLRAHLERLRTADAGLVPLIKLLTTPATGRTVAETGTWQDAVRALFAQVREQDSLVTAMVAGSQNVTLGVADASGEMKLVHESIHNLILKAQALLNASSTAK